MRELVAEHVRPLLLDLVAVRRRLERRDVGNIDTGERAFLFERDANGAHLTDQIWMPMDVDDVVEVARPAPLGERTDLLRGEIGSRVGENPASRQRLVAVRMHDVATHRSVHHRFVAR